MGGYTPLQKRHLIWRYPSGVHPPLASDRCSFGVVLWELWTGLEPYADLNYHALMMRLAADRATGEQLRPPLPGSPEWDGEPVAELAPGWRSLVTRCWAEDPAVRPSFSGARQRPSLFCHFVHRSCLPGALPGPTNPCPPSQPCPASDAVRIPWPTWLQRLYASCGAWSWPSSRSAPAAAARACAGRRRRGLPRAAGLAAAIDPPREAD